MQYYSCSITHTLIMDAVFLQAIGVLVAALVLLHSFWRFLTNSHGEVNGRRIQAPKPKGAWPILGHIPLLGGQNPVFRTLAAMADKNGPVFRIQLGFRQALVVSSKEAVLECFTNNDHVFMTRPNSVFLRYMGYNGAVFGLAPYGPFWREMRKISTHEVLSKRRLELLKDVRASEVTQCIKELYLLCCKNGTVGSAKFNMAQWLLQVTINIMMQMIARKRYCSVGDGGNDMESRRFGKAIKEIFYLLGAFELSDMIPFTEWMDLQGHLRSMKRNAKELDYFMSCWLDEHIQSRGEKDQAKEEPDFIDVMLSLFAESDGLIHGHKSSDVIKATVLNLILAGADTSSVNMTWAISLLLNHNKVLQKAQQELDIHVGKERLVEESDIKNLVYLQAIVKETLRLYPPGPLSVPREALEDCTVAGYYVPKGTQLLVNLWKLHRDSGTWTDPCKFQPERFLTSHAEFDVRGQQFEYVPFGSGRRSCPGITASLQMMHLTLARLLQSFDLATPMNEQVDMSEGLGLTLPKKYPLELVFTPRLSSKLYQLQHV